MNPLDTHPGEIKYRGVITDWRSKFGFMVTDQMEGKVFLPSKDVTEGRVLARVGAEALFQVLPHIHHFHLHCLSGAAPGEQCCWSQGCERQDSEVIGNLWSVLN